MLSDSVLEKLLAEHQAQFREIEQEYLDKMAKHIRDLGHLTPSDVNRLTEMRRMRLITDETAHKIARASNVTSAEMEQILRRAAGSNVEFARQWFGDAGKRPVSSAVRRLLEAQISVSKGAFANLSRTTVDNRAYRSAIDAGIRAVSSGTTDYRTAIKRAMRQAATNGLRVIYPPKTPGGRPYTRRLDSAVRMNILDGVRSLNNAMLRQLGDEYGADGVEVSAHVLCAPDHIDVQGRQFSKKEFYGPGGIESSLRRAFGTCNCKHTIYPIILGISEPAYSDEQLAEINRLSTEEVTIGEGENARTMTRYEWSQEQRRLETAIRQQKDLANASSGDPETRREAQRRIDELNDRYDEVINGAGLRSSRDRMVVDGWQGNGVGNASPEQLRRGESWRIPETQVPASLGGLLNNLTSEAESGNIIDNGVRSASWEGLRARSVTKIQHGFHAFPSTDDISTYVLRVPPKENCFDVAMHGDSSTVYFGDEGVRPSARELAALIRKQGWDGKETIRLLSCSTGRKDSHDEVCFAEELATALGVPVEAPDGILYISETGALSVGRFGNGKFVTYKPNEIKRLGGNTHNKK